MPDHGLPREPELERVGDRDDLHHAAVDRAAGRRCRHGRLGEADLLADGRRTSGRAVAAAAAR